jgi:hypothetical protein
MLEEKALQIILPPKIEQTSQGQSANLSSGSLKGEHGQRRIRSFRFFKMAKVPYVLSAAL